MENYIRTHRRKFVSGTIAALVLFLPAVSAVITTPISEVSSVNMQLTEATLISFRSENVSAIEATTTYLSNIIFGAFICLGYLIQKKPVAPYRLDFYDITLISSAVAFSILGLYFGYLARTLSIEAPLSPKLDLEQINAFISLMGTFTYFAAVAVIGYAASKGLESS